MVAISGVSLPVVPSTSHAETPAIPTAPAPAQSAPAPAAGRGADAVVISTSVGQGGGTANPYILGDRSFTIFQDASGQLITRYRSLRDGSVTYIPKPDATGFSAKARTAPEQRTTSLKIDA